MSIDSSDYPYTFVIDSEPVENLERGQKLMEGLVDDPTIDLSSFRPKEVQDRLLVNFIGYEHLDPDECGDREYAEKNAEYVAEKIATLEPDIIVHEQVGGSQQARNADELLSNLVMQDIGFAILDHETGNLIHSSTISADDLPGSDSRICAHLAKKGVRPIVRFMDMSDEQFADQGYDTLSEDDISPSLFHKNWPISRPFSEIVENVTAHYLRTGAIHALRNQQMATDVSRIAGNALAARSGKVNVAACFGASHIVTADIFRNQGYPARSHIFSDGFEDNGILANSPHVRLYSEVAKLGSVQRQTVYDYLIEHLLIDTIMIGLITETEPSPESKEIDEKINIARAAASKIEPYQEMALLALWDDVYSARALLNTPRRIAKRGGRFIALVEETTRGLLNA